MPSTPEALVTGRLTSVTRRPSGRDTSTAARCAREISSAAFSLRITWSRRAQLRGPVRPPRRPGAGPRRSSTPASRYARSRARSRAELCPSSRRSMASAALRITASSAGCSKPARIAEAQDALDAPAERVAHGKRAAGARLGALGEVLGAVDLDRAAVPPGRDRCRWYRRTARRTRTRGRSGSPGGSWPATRLRSGAGEPCRRRRRRRCSSALPANLDSQPVEHRYGRAGDPVVRVEVLPEGKVGPVRRQPQGPAALPGAQDRRAHALLNRLPLQESLTERAGPCRLPCALNIGSSPDRTTPS